MSDRPMGDPPQLLALLLCDQILTEEGTKKKIIVGTFNRVHASNFPAVHPAMSVFVSLSGKSGACEVKIRITRPNGDSLVEIGGSLNFPEIHHVHELSFNLQKMVFAEPGNHFVSVLIDGDELWSRRLEVIQIRKES